MASEKQIAANRRNARKSTGPKTIAGKKRASLNALRHGLASQGLRTSEAERVEQLARQIAGDFKNRAVLEFARSFAAAHHELAQVRQVRAGWIAFASSLGSLGPLEELRRIYRYEVRAAARRDRAIRKISEQATERLGLGCMA